MLYGLGETAKISTHSPRAGRTLQQSRLQTMSFISTHSPRAGRTRAESIFYLFGENFNSLAPCGANRSSNDDPICSDQFQLTRPVRGEPVPMRLVWQKSKHFNSLAPCGANRPLRDPSKLSCQFQLTRPVRGEPSVFLRVVSMAKFQLTRPVRGEPSSEHKTTFNAGISTHSPRAGRTCRGDHQYRRNRNFNSLAPCGANPDTRLFRGIDKAISTHSPRAGRTAIASTHRAGSLHFNSLAPCGANPQTKD